MNTSVNNLSAPKTVTFEIWYTTAPKAYDGFGTITFTEAEESGKYDHRGNPLRKVGILPDHSNWQRTRYSSGLYATLTDEDIAEYNF